MPDEEKQKRSTKHSNTDGTERIAVAKEHKINDHDGWHGDHGSRTHQGVHGQGQHKIGQRDRRQVDGAEGTGSGEAA